MRISAVFLTVATLILPRFLTAQEAVSPAPIEPAAPWRATLTVFRSPGTGIQMSKGHFAAFVAHYPTVIKRDGDLRSMQFIRLGAAYYVTPSARTSPYVSVSFAPSLSEGWGNSAMIDLGARRRFTRRLSGQLGVALLHAPTSHETRVNPTVGFGVHF